MEIIMAYPSDIQFYEVDGFPVTLGVVPDIPQIPYCAVWDKEGPREFSVGVAFNYGIAITKERFESLVIRFLSETETA